MPVNEGQKQLILPEIGNIICDIDGAENIESLQQYIDTLNAVFVNGKDDLHYGHLPLLFSEESDDWITKLSEVEENGLPSEVDLLAIEAFVLDQIDAVIQEKAAAFQKSAFDLGWDKNSCAVLNGTVLSNAQREDIKSSVLYEIDFSNLKEFKKLKSEIEKITLVLQGGYHEEYEAMAKAFKKPSLLNNIDKHGVHETTVGAVREYMAMYANNEIEKKAAELKVSAVELGWNKDNLLSLIQAMPASEKTLKTKGVARDYDQEARDWEGVSDDDSSYDSDYDSSDESSDVANSFDPGSELVQNPRLVEAGINIDQIRYLSRELFEQVVVRLNEQNIFELVRDQILSVSYLTSNDEQFNLFKTRLSVGNIGLAFRDGVIDLEDIMGWDDLRFACFQSRWDGDTNESIRKLIEDDLLRVYDLVRFTDQEFSYLKTRWNDDKTKKNVAELIRSKVWSLDYLANWSDVEFNRIITRCTDKEKRLVKKRQLSIDVLLGIDDEKFTRFQTRLNNENIWQLVEKYVLNSANLVNWSDEQLKRFEIRWADESNENIMSLMQLRVLHPKYLSDFNDEEFSRLKSVLVEIKTRSYTVEERKSSAIRRLASESVVHLVKDGILKAEELATWTDKQFNRFESVIKDIQTSYGAGERKYAKERLVDKDIRKLVADGLFVAFDLVTLSDERLNLLKSKWSDEANANIRELVREGVLNSRDLAKWSDEQLKRFETRWADESNQDIKHLVVMGHFYPEYLSDFNDEEFNRLKYTLKEIEYDDEDSEYDDVAVQQEDCARRRLANKSVVHLVKDGVLRPSDLAGWRDEEFNRFQTRWNDEDVRQLTRDGILEDFHLARCSDEQFNRFQTRWNAGENEGVRHLITSNFIYWNDEELNLVKLRLADENIRQLVQSEIVDVDDLLEYDEQKLARLTILSGNETIRQLFIDEILGSDDLDKILDSEDLTDEKFERIVDILSNENISKMLRNEDKDFKEICLWDDEEWQSIKTAFSSRSPTHAERMTSSRSPSPERIPAPASSHLERARSSSSSSERSFSAIASSSRELY